MKLNNYLIGALGSLCALTACQTEADSLTIYDTDTSAARFAASVGSRTDSDSSTSIDSGVKIGISADGGQSYITYISGTDGALSPEGDDYLKWRAGSMDILAHTPVADGISATAFSLPTDQSTGTTNADFMTFGGTITRSGESVDFQLQRRMALVNVTIASVDQKYATDHTFDVTIYSPAAGLSLSYDNDTEVATTGSSTAVKPNGGTDMTTSGKASAIVTPGTLSSAKFISVDVKKNNVTVKTLHANATQTFTAGNSYNFSLTIKDDEVYLGSVLVNPWTDVTLDGGNMTEPEPEPDTDTDNTPGTPEAPAPDTNAIDITNLTHSQAVEALTGKTEVTLTGELGALSLKDILADAKLTSTLKSINLSGVGGLTEIAKETFYNFSALESVTLPETVLTIGEGAFKNCEKLKAFESQSATKICLGAFSSCTSLQSVSFPKVTDIEGSSVDADGAFFSAGLTSVYFPKVITIGSRSFSSCPSLTEATFESAITLGESAFVGCSSLVTLNLPYVEEVGSSALRCSSLRNLSFSKSVYLNLKEGAFGYSSITKNITLTIYKKNNYYGSIDTYSCKWNNVTYAKIIGVS
jgi:hypothetical protein